MSQIHTTLSKLYTFALPIAQRLYRYPLLMGIVLSVLSSCYLIADYSVVNRSVLDVLWRIDQHQAVDTPFARLIQITSESLHLSALTAGHTLMVLSHALLTALLLLIAKQLFFSKTTRWALIFLLLCNESYDDFRTYIIVEPLFWCLWLFAIYSLLLFYRQRTILIIVLWFVLFLIGTQWTVASWFWLLLFPFGTLFWKPWKNKSVAYALMGYALVVFTLLLIPMEDGTTPLEWLFTVVGNPNRLSDILGLNQSNWVKDENSFMAGLFVFTGATTLIIIRTIISFGLASSGLAVYAVLRKQYKIIDNERLKILIYIVAFNLFISVILFVLDKDSGSLVSFSVSLLAFLLAALGLSYVFKKIAMESYSRLTTLVIIWCLVAYFASGMIIFGPRKGYLRAGGEYAQQWQNTPVYANDSVFLFFAGRNPNDEMDLDAFETLMQREIRQGKPFYFAYSKNRKSDLPQMLQRYTPLNVQFANPRGDKLLIYRFPQAQRAEK